MVWDVVELRLKIDARAVMVETNQPVDGAASEEGALGFDRPRDRAFGCANGTGMIARGGNSLSFRPWKHKVGRCIFSHTGGLLGNDDIRGRTSQFPIGLFLAPAAEGARSAIEARQIVA